MTAEGDALRIVDAAIAAADKVFNTPRSGRALTEWNAVLTRELLARGVTFESERRP